MGHQPVPDEQHEQRADGRADETRALIEPVPTDGLADEGCDERAGDPEPSRQYEAIQVVRTGREETRDDAGDEADHDDPDNVRHDDLPGLALGSSMVARSGNAATAARGAIAPGRNVRRSPFRGRLFHNRRRATASLARQTLWPSVDTRA
jgi:hypothetical protein